MAAKVKVCVQLADYSPRDPARWTTPFCPLCVVASAHFVVSVRAGVRC
jgi:hypothetical protein